MFGPLPSFQGNVRTLDVLRRQLACDPLPLDPQREKRYPYLDRDLLEFMYAIPREQLVRPGQRRSLMRRALIGTVPDGLLNRKRKAFVSRRPLVAIATEWTSIVQMSKHMTTSFFAIVDPEDFIEALQKARRGQVVPLVPFLRTLTIEPWLAHVMKWKVLHDTRNERDRAQPRTIERESLFVSTKGLSQLGKLDKERR